MKKFKGPAGPRPWAIPKPKPDPESYALAKAYRDGIKSDDIKDVALADKWIAAFEAFQFLKQQKCDAKPLAALLRSGAGAPADILELLAELIDPKNATFDYKLVPKLTRDRTKREKRSSRAFKIAINMSTEFARGHTVEVAAENVGKRLGLKPRQILKLWKPNSNNSLYSRKSRFRLMIVGGAEAGDGKKLALRALQSGKAALHKTK
jgi:hypothetical protein